MDSPKCIVCGMTKAQIRWEKQHGGTYKCWTTDKDGEDIMFRSHTWKG